MDLFPLCCHCLQSSEARALACSRTSQGYTSGCLAIWITQQGCWMCKEHTVEGRGRQPKSQTPPASNICGLLVLRASPRSLSSWGSAYGASSLAGRVIYLFLMDFPYLLIFPDLGQKRGALTLLGDRWARRALLKPVVLQFSTGYQLHLSVHHCTLIPKEKRETHWFGLSMLRI